MKKYLAIVVVLISTFLICGATYFDKPNRADSNHLSSNKVEWVDLNLPSGILWCSCNIGATTPEGYGNYFAWGEIKPKDSYSWNNYIYSDDNNRLTKYDTLILRPESINLEPTDDAAHAIWGDGAHIPTEAEWYELVYNTTNIWTTLNGVHGYLLTSQNGNSIFLPAAGQFIGNNLYFVNEFGYYWSSSLHAGDEAVVCRFCSPAIAISSSSRAYGFPVRAVRKKNVNKSIQQGRLQRQ